MVPVGAAMLTVPVVGKPLTVVFALVIIGRALKTGVSLDSESLTIRNFFWTSKVEISEIRWIGLECLRPWGLVWRLSSSWVLRVETSNGRVVRSYCLTEGESLLPVPKPSEIAWILDEVARL
jgi:hypothetical protein